MPGTVPRYLIWSNQHRAWWRPNGYGYTAAVDLAGRYEREHAERIVADATCNGQLTVRRTDPYTGDEYSSVDEVMILAPEHIEPEPITVPVKSCRCGVLAGEDCDCATFARGAR